MKKNRTEPNKKQKLTNEEKQIISLFNKPKVVAVCGDVNQGKSMLLYHLLETLLKAGKFKLYTYGLRLKINDAKQIYSIPELESIKNSLIIVDELSSLFDLDNRKNKKLVENSLRLINHNNNILVVCGTPENFKKFISAKADVFIFKNVTFADVVNGSRTKNVLMNYKGNESGSSMLNLPVNEALIYDGTHYSKIKIPYYKKYDSKADNEDIVKITK